MTTFPGSPKILKGGIVLIDPETWVVQRIIALQYNPESLSRTLQVQGTGGEGGAQSEALRLTGPPIETIKLDAEIDATDQLEFPDQNPPVAELGIAPQLATLETIIYPSSQKMQENNSLAESGALEIIPVEALLTLFIWSKNRILPVKITEFSIAEEAFDTSLNPIRAKVSLGMQVLTSNDLGLGHRGSNLFNVYHKLKESLAGMLPSGSLSELGVRRIP